MMLLMQCSMCKVCNKPKVSSKACNAKDWQIFDKDKEYGHDSTTKQNINGFVVRHRFCGNQDPEMAIVDRATTKSRTGYIVILRYAL